MNKISKMANTTYMKSTINNVIIRSFSEPSANKIGPKPKNVTPKKRTKNMT